MEDYITIETHFGVPEHFIRAATRNRCSEDLTAIILEIASILYPSDDFDIYLLAAEPGSYKDIIKFVKKNKIGSAVGAVVAVGTLTLGYLNYFDSHEKHTHEKGIWIIGDTEKCLQLRKLLDDLEKNYEMQNIPDEKLKEVCGNVDLKHRKNSLYNTLARDSMIQDNEIMVIDDKNNLIASKKVERENFKKYVEPILDQKLTHENVEGVIEIISPVFKQKREGKGIAWRGTYYGDDVVFKSISLIKNGDDIEFYMQDQDFKDQIIKKERTFAVGDNMKVSFDIIGEIKGGEFMNRSFYIKEVRNYNEDIVFHKNRLDRNSKHVQTGPGLF